MTWLLSAPLVGLIAATYLAPVRDMHPQLAAGSRRAGVASIGAFLAIGCPICNKVMVTLLGVSGAMTVFAPLQPVIGTASLALLSASLLWRLRERVRGCARCMSTPAGA